MRIMGGTTAGIGAAGTVAAERLVGRLAYGVPYNLDLRLIGAAFVVQAAGSSLVVVGVGSSRGGPLVMGSSCLVAAATELIGSLEVASAFLKVVEIAT